MQISALEALLTGKLSTLTLTPDGATLPDEPPSGAIFSGAFNPLHHGHVQLAQAATRCCDLPVAFELAVVNADKGTLAPNEIARRAAQFAGRHTLVLSRFPLFVQKAAIYPGRTFVLGYDTAARLLDPRYYQGTIGLEAALNTLALAECRFLVAGRMHNGQFATLADLYPPPAFAHLFTPIPEALFRADVSSSALRARARVR
ncbi:MAG: hypothetical protein AB4911_07070 [Oscillochloridaceae bacterium umkhey_bin13]